MNYGYGSKGDENGRVEKGARKFIGEEGEERRLYVVFAIGIKLEDKERGLGELRGLLTGSYLQVRDDPASKAVERGRRKHDRRFIVVLFKEL